MGLALPSPIPPSRKVAVYPARVLGSWKATIDRMLAEDE
jgi:hypothetical protein